MMQFTGAGALPATRATRGERTAPPDGRGTSPAAHRCRGMPRTLRLARIACLAALTRAAAPAAADVAPGRVAFSVATQVPERNVDAGGAGPTVALPGGGAVMVAYGPGADLTLVQLRADGSLDPASGN